MTLRPNECDLCTPESARECRDPVCRARGYGESIPSTSDLREQITAVIDEFGSSVSQLNADLMAQSIESKVVAPLLAAKQATADLWSAHAGDYLADREREIGRRVAAEARVAELTRELALDLLRTFADPSPCRHDHHGHCQEHGWLDEGECNQKRLAEFLAGLGRPAAQEPMATELPEHRVAITVFATVRAVDERDAGAIATYAIHDTLGDQQIVTVKDDPRVVRVIDVMDTGMAAGNGYLWLRPTAKAYFEAGVPTGGDGQ